MWYRQVHPCSTLVSTVERVVLLTLGGLCCQWIFRLLGGKGHWVKKERKGPAEGAHDPNESHN